MPAPQPAAARRPHPGVRRSSAPAATGGDIPRGRDELPRRHALVVTGGEICGLLARHRVMAVPRVDDGDGGASHDGHHSAAEPWADSRERLRPAAPEPLDRSLKEALRSGRLYGAFEFLGYPSGFDFRAEETSAVREMGEETAIASGAELVASVPTLRGLDPAAAAPEITAKLLYAIEGGWEEITTSTSEIHWKPTKAGAYRVEVRMVPHHLSSYLHSYADFATKDTVWVYSNPIYVVD